MLTSLSAHAGAFTEGSTLRLKKLSTAAEMVHVRLRPGPSDRRTKPPSSAACLDLSETYRDSEEIVSPE